MKKKGLVILLLVMSGLGAGMVEGDERKLELDVIDTSGSWVSATPMYLKTASSGSYKKAVINATNIDETDVLNDLQYTKFIFDYIEYEEPTVSKTFIKYKFDLAMNFTDISTTVRVIYDWELEYDTGVTVYDGWFFVVVNGSTIFQVNESGYDDTHRLEVHIWRTKSDQLAIYYKLNDEDDLKLLNPLSSWDVGNFTYWFEDEVGYTGTFTVRFDDLSVQSGTDEGIQDPIENTDWGIFEPIRQILLFILD